VAAHVVNTFSYSCFLLAALTAGGVITVVIGKLRRGKVSQDAEKSNWRSRRFLR
jgi:hypothetical protein